MPPKADEEKKQNNSEETTKTNSTSEKSLSETIIALQTKYDEEHKLRLQAENDVIQLTKAIRTMEIPTQKEEKKESAKEEDLKKLFRLKKFQFSMGIKTPGKTLSGIKEKCLGSSLGILIPQSSQA